MRIVTDFYLDVPRNYWEDRLADDPLDFPVVRAVEKLAEHHECHFFCSSQEEQGEKEINGMRYHIRRHWREWLPEMKALKPDVLITNGYFEVSAGVAAALPRARKILVLHCEPANVLLGSMFDANAWKRFDTVITALDLGKDQLLNAFPDMNVKVVPFGVNIELCRSFVVPMGHKEQVACGAGWYPNKGNLFVDAVLRSIVVDFHRPCGQNWGGMPKKQFIQHMAQAKVIFFPSYSEGTSRSLTEAAAAGVMPVVAAESMSNVEHVRKMGGMAIRTGMYRTPHPEHHHAVKFTMRPEEIAEQLINIADSLHEYTPNLGDFSARASISKYIDVITAPK